MFYFTVLQNALFPIVPAARHKDCHETTAYRNLIVKSCAKRSFGKPFKGGLHSDGSLRKILSLGGWSGSVAGFVRDVCGYVRENVYKAAGRIKFIALR